MASTKKQTAVLYVDVNKAFFYAGSIGNTLQLSFPPDVISDLDLVNAGKFEQFIDSFIQSNVKGQEFEVILVFSHNAVFEKDLIITDPERIEAQIQSFIDIVPFEEVLSKSYKFNKKVKIVGVNKAIYDVIKEAFEKNKSVISMALPLSVLQETNAGLGVKMDLGAIAIKLDSFKQYNMIEREFDPVGEQKTEDSKKPNRKLYILVGTFVILLLVLFVFAYKTLFSKSVPKQGPVVLPAFTPVPTVQIENISPATPSGSVPVDSF